MDCPAILKTSRPGVPGRVNGAFGSVSMRILLKGKKKSVLATMLLLDEIPVVFTFLYCIDSSELSTDAPQLAQ